MNPINLRDEFILHCHHIKNQSPGTLQTYRHLLGFFIQTTGILDIGQVDESMIYRFFLHGRVERKWKSTTYMRYYNSLLVFFRWCVKRGVMASNPIVGMDRPSIEQTLPKGLKQSESETIVEVAFNLTYAHDFLRHRNRAIIATFLHTGLRRQELLHLRLTDIDLESRMLFVRQGKGAKDRMIPMNATLVSILNSYLQQRRGLKKSCPELFASYRLNMGLTLSGLRRLVCRIQKSCGIEFHIHMLRKTFATLMIQSGCDVAQSDAFDGSPRH